MADKNIIELDEKKPKKSDKLKNIIEKLKNLKNINVGSKIGAIGAKISPYTAKIQKAKILFENKKILYPTLIGGAILAIVIAILIFILNKEEPLQAIYAPKPQPVSSSAPITKISKADKKELQNLIQKAGLLYNNGQIAEALVVYNNISMFSQSFASFNLGVSKLKANDFKSSIDAFGVAINSGENVAASAINAAMAAYRLGDLKAYDYYVNLARGTMIEWFDKPLYSYLYALSNYYSNNYFNALSALVNPTSNYYPQQNINLLSNIYLSFNDDYNALDTLLKNQNDENNYAIGLLYARLGDYNEAYVRINDFVRANPSDLEAQMALGLIELKRSNFINASSMYQSLLQSHPASTLHAFYPLKIKLNRALFDIDSVQKNFWNRTAGQNNAVHYKILFYFAPFRVFDVNNAINAIQSGGLELKMNNLEGASNILARGVLLTRIDSSITQGLKEVLKNNMSSALNIMINAAESYPNHQVLQYNLGLLYAQNNDFQNARKHFLKAYHLDRSDVLSGIFALMCAMSMNIDDSRIQNEIMQNFSQIEFENERQEAFYRSFFGYISGNLVDEMRWWDSNTSGDKFNVTPLMGALRALYLINSRDKTIISGAFRDLANITNNDMVALILSRIAAHYNENIKAFSLNLFSFFKNDLKNLDLVYAGPALAREIYIYMAFLVGANSYVDSILQNKLLSDKNSDAVGILQALGLNSIYLNDFERAFVYYNALIDDYGIKNSENYFLASVAAIGAGHYDNAVALMQLSRMESDFNLEARYALGLLHHTMGNLELASFQYMQIPNDGFRSAFFDFEIDTSAIVEGSYE